MDGRQKVYKDGMPNEKAQQALPAAVVRGYLVTGPNNAGRNRLNVQS